MLEDEHPIGALECVAQEIRGAFIDLQRRADERRVLAFDIGETNAQLVATMTAAGITEQGARQANVRALAGGHYRLVGEHG